jgi:uncharacterized protein (DUF2062 family)
MGLMPFIGLQIVLALVVCFFLRVNLIAAVAATFICNPLTAVGIIWLQLLIGRWLLNPGVIDPAGDPAGAINFLLVNGKALLAGSLLTALPAALLVYLSARLFWKALSRGTIEP